MTWKVGSSGTAMLVVGVADRHQTRVPACVFPFEAEMETLWRFGSCCTRLSKMFSGVKFLRVQLRCRCVCFVLH